MKIVILAGGKGKRMGDLSKNIPKPMIPVAGKPILEHQIDLVKKYGYKDIILLTGYKHEVIQDYFEDGRKWDFIILYNRKD
tara:strand:- start:683 stop:925 length:243 start_codon:yes stop_codon:yes gene_type:complete